MALYLNWNAANTATAAVGLFGEKLLKDWSDLSSFAPLTGRAYPRSGCSA